MWTVYRCPRLRRGEAPHDETPAATGFATPGEAMDAANAMKRADPAHSYTVGAS